METYLSKQKTKTTVMYLGSIVSLKKNEKSI